MSYVNYISIKLGEKKEREREKGMVCVLFMKQALRGQYVLIYFWQGCG